MRLPPLAVPPCRVRLVVDLVHRDDNLFLLWSPYNNSSRRVRPFRVLKRERTLTLSIVYPTHAANRSNWRERGQSLPIEKTRRGSAC